MEPARAEAVPTKTLHHPDRKRSARLYERSTDKRGDLVSDNIVTQKPRREVWLQIALAVANGLPEPRELGFHPHIPLIGLDLDRTADAQAWAQWCGAESARNNHYWDSSREFGGKWGYSWQIRGPREPEPVESINAELALANELIDAIGGGQR